MDKTFQSLRVAIADDDRYMREMLTSMLVSLGHTVVSVASNGRDLVEQCAAISPDLVISDIFMPEMNGIDAAREIASILSVPMILLSSNSARDLILEAEKRDIAAYLVKPLTRDNLEASILLACTRNRRRPARSLATLATGASISMMPRGSSVIRPYIGPLANPPRGASAARERPTSLNDSGWN